MIINSDNLSLLKDTVESIVDNDKDQYEEDLIVDFLLSATKQPYEHIITYNASSCGGGGGGGGGGCGGCR